MTINIKDISNLETTRYSLIDLDTIHNDPSIFSVQLKIFDKDKNIADNIKLDFSKEINKTIFIEQNSLRLNPGIHLRNLGYISGSYNIHYEFYMDFFGNNTLDKNFTIKEISPSRYELKSVLINSNISTDDLNSFISNKDAKNLDTYINFNDNLNYLLLNIIQDIPTDNKLFKLRLLNPLDINISRFDSFYISKKIIDDYDDSIILFTEDSIDTQKLNILSPPDFQNSTIGNVLGSHTDFSSYETLTQASNSLDRNKIVSFYLSSSLSSGISELNTDYRKYNNFIHFSSAQTRLKNFVYKLKQIESYDNQLLKLNNITSASNLYEVSNSIQTIQNNKFDIINTFDDYENFMYYVSGSYESSSLGIYPDYTWPKYTSVYPYSLCSVTSSAAITWYNKQLTSASLYDNSNQDRLINVIPILMLQDNYNTDYVNFIEMIGHQLDIIYIYINNLTTIYNMDASIDKGIPRDLINDVLSSFGINVVGGYRNRNLEQLYITSGSNINFSQ